MEARIEFGENNNENNNANNKSLWNTSRITTRRFGGIGITTR